MNHCTLFVTFSSIFAAGVVMANEVPPTVPPVPSILAGTIDMTKVLTDMNGQTLLDGSKRLSDNEKPGDLTLGRVVSVALCSSVQADLHELAIDTFRRCKRGEALAHDIAATLTAAEVKSIEDHLPGSWTAYVITQTVGSIDPDAVKSLEAPKVVAPAETKP